MAEERYFTGNRQFEYTADRQWRVDAIDGHMPDGRQGVQVLVSERNVNWLLFETPMPGFEANSTSTTIKWTSSSSKRCVVHIRGGVDKGANVVIVPEKRLFSCEFIVPRVVLLPHHEILFVWGALFLGACAGWWLQRRFSVHYRGKR